MDQASSDVFKLLMLSIPAPKLGVKRAILMIFDCETVFIKLLLSTLIIRLLIVFKAVSYTHLTLPTTPYV